MSKPNIRSLSITSQESYSAVMIADVVADIPISLETEQGSQKSAKEQTNLGYDGHLDGDAKRHAVDGIDATNSSITNGGGIGRGVILNAVQFGQSDEKAIQMTAALPAPSVTQPVSEPQGFKDMSFPRKIAFGFSFLPSILFVLCFSVILPCNVPKQCVDELWVTTLNHTEALSRLEIQESVMFTALEKKKSVLVKLDKENGLKKKSLNFDTSSAFLICGNITSEKPTECFVMDGEGKFYTFNDTDSSVIWEAVSQGETPSKPVILPDCNDDKVDEVALAVSSNTIKFMYSATTSSTLRISVCDTVPTKLTSWATNGSSDLVFVCKKEGADRVVKIPQNMWCPYTQNAKEEALILHTGAMDSLSETVLLPVENGLVLWTEDEISMVQPDGSVLWQFFNTSHSDTNRYLLYGSFKEGNKQVALLSSSTLSGLKVTLLNSLNGSLIKSTSFPDSQATDVITVHGKKDFIVILRKKVKMPTDIVTTAALTQIKDFSTTIVNFISNEEVGGVTDKLTSQEVSLWDTEKELVTIRELKDLQDAAYSTTMTALYDEDLDTLHIYLMSTTEKNSTENTTKVRKIKIAEWIKSKKAKCLGKVL